jgi:5-methylcytosine-specific restriction endonuclease McrBC GTP-binding regulatory subunit McrB
VTTIPKNITKEHVIKAIDYIDENGYDQKYESDNHDLIYNGKHYPPKRVLSQANVYANGSPLVSFHGGLQTNSFLEKIGFEIASKNGTSLENALLEDNMNYKLKQELIENQELIDTKYNELKNNGQIEFITFHPSYSYDEFIEGITIKDEIDGEEEVKNPYIRKDGLFKSFCAKALKAALSEKISDDKNKWKELYQEYKVLEKDERKKIWHDAENNPKKKYILIIDEINRGDMSKIFGELITLLEADKRLGSKNELVVKLSLSNDDFAVPPNVYIIGTMNTADRSIALIDIALRRRFGFIEMTPDLKRLEDDFENLPNGCMLSKSIEELKRINERIRNEENLGKEKEIGHSFFYSVSGKNDDYVIMVWINEIFPLLEEYFFGEYDKLAEICGKVYNQELKRFDVHAVEGWLNGS